MRPSILARAGAVLTASALTLSLGAGTASAADSQTQTGAVAATPTTTAAVITGFNISSGVVTTAAINFFPGTVSATDVSGPVTAQTDVRVNGVFRGRAALYPDGVDLPRQFGSGTVQLGPTYFSDGTVDYTLSNVFNARKLVTTLRKDGYALSIKRRNSKISFTARQIKVVNPSTGSYSRVRSVKLQQLRGGKWKTKKTIKLNSKGNGSYSTKLKTKYRYRLYIPQTANQTSFETRKTGRI